MGRQCCSQIVFHEYEEVCCTQQWLIAAPEMACVIASVLLPLGALRPFLKVTPQNAPLRRRQPRAMLSIEQLKAISGCAKIRPGAARASSSLECQPRSIAGEVSPEGAVGHASVFMAHRRHGRQGHLQNLVPRSGFALTRGRWAPMSRHATDWALPWEDRNFNKQEHVTDEGALLAAWKVAEPCLAELAGSVGVRSGRRWVLT